MLLRQRAYCRNLIVGALHTLRATAAKQLRLNPDREKLRIEPAGFRAHRVKVAVAELLLDIDVLVEQALRRIDVHVDGFVRQYSLLGAPCAAPARYRIAVLKTAASRGGSEAVHARLQAGSALRISVPRNLFPLQPQSPWSLLVAGEIEFFVTNEGFHFDHPPPRIETLGHFPISLIVRAGHPLLSSDCPGEKFPVVRSSWTGLPLPTDIQERMRGTANVIEDFGALAAITATSDAIWFSSTYAVTGELRDGSLCELPRTEPDYPKGVRVMMYSLERRSPSPLARSLKQVLQQQIKLLASRPPSRSP